MKKSIINSAKKRFKNLLEIFPDSKFKDEVVLRINHKTNRMKSALKMIAEFSYGRTFSNQHGSKR